MFGIWREESSALLQVTISTGKITINHCDFHQNYDEFHVEIWIGRRFQAQQDVHIEKVPSREEVK